MVNTNNLQECKKILWLSRHVPTKSQLVSLRKLYGDNVEVVQDHNSFDSVEKIVNRYYEGNYDDMVIVAPMFFISKIVEFGIHPLWAQMKQVEFLLAETSNNGRHYIFSGFKRIKKLCFEFDEVLIAA